MTLVSADTVSPDKDGPRLGGIGWVPRLTLLIMLGPVAAGLLFTLLPAIGYMPSLGASEIGLAPIPDWPLAPA